MGTWDDATRALHLEKEARLVCPFCGATNSPEKLRIELRPDGMANCSECLRKFPPQEK